MSETLAQLAARVGRNHRTVWNWITRGVTIGERTVKLAAERVGRNWSVSAEAWARFQADCNPGARPLPESPAKAARRMSADRRRLAEQIGGAAPVGKAVEP